MAITLDSEDALEDSPLAQPWAVGLSEPLGGVVPPSCKAMGVLALVHAPKLFGRTFPF